MKVAVVHDRLCNRGGGERVATTIAQVLNADIYTARWEPEKCFVELERMRVKEVNRLPDLGWDKYYVLVRMVDASRFYSLGKLGDYDVIWTSGMWAFFASCNNKRNIWYCHSPNRGIYDLANLLRERQGAFWKPIFDVWRWFWERMDKRAMRYVNKIVTNSENTRKRVRRFYGREARVVYPPVDVEKFYHKPPEDYFLSVQRIMPEKRVDLQVKVFKRLPNERLVIVGKAEYGTWYEREVAKLVESTPNIEWRGKVRDEELLELYARCKATIQTPIDEDFGLIPVESMAAGKACIAVNEGGLRESIIDGKTGLLIEKPYEENFIKAIKCLNPSEFEAKKLQRHAKRFSRKRFVKEIRRITGERG